MVAKDYFMEQRKAARLGCVVPVEGKADSVFADVRTIDISNGGIGFVSSQVLPLRKRIAVELLLEADADPVLVMGEVRWVRKIKDSEHFRVGMKFIRSVEQGSRTRLKSYFEE